MRRASLLIVAMAVALLGLFAVPAAAQDGPAITIEPASVDAAGEATVTVTGSGWSSGAVFVLKCAGAEGSLEQYEELGAAACDTNDLTPVTADADGAFTTELTVEVPETGIVVAAGNAAQTESAAAVISVGGGEGEEGGEEAAEEEAEAAEEDAEAAEEDAEAAEEEAETAEAELASTGSESGLYAIIAIAVIAAGAMVVGLGRKARLLR